MTPPPIEVRVVDDPREARAQTLVVAQLRTTGGGFGGHAEGRWDEGRWDLVGPFGAAPDEAPALLGALAAECRRLHPGPLDWWVDGPDDASDALAASLGLVTDRELLQMRRSLPVDGPPPGIETRPFVVGRDDDAWLAVNNAAFHWHEDQRDWTRADLDERFTEPWFDPDGFLVHERDGRMAGFCWTKVHDDEVPPVGEIFVIAVHPDFHGLGLGRALTLAGLRHLAQRGLTVGMLYVESDNEAALGLYRDLGFTVHRRRRRYRAGS